MRADKDSIDYQVNLVALQEMEEVVPMTLRERCCLRKWVRQGNEVESNPWNYMDSDGMPLNYLQAFRNRSRPRRKRDRRRKGNLEQCEIHD